MLNVVCAIVEHEGKILCLQKGKHKYPYISEHWEFAGGKVEAGESPEEALRRELMEEMDYKVEVVRHVKTVEHQYPDFSLRLMAYLCRPVDGDSATAYVLHEHVQALWLAPEHLHRLAWAEADHAIIDEIVRLFAAAPTAI